MRSAAVVSMVLSLACGSAAQRHPMGFIDGWDQGSGGISFFHSPQNLFFEEGDFLTRIDTDDYFGWGRDPSADPTYGTFCLVGVQFRTADPNPTTPESPAWIVAWTEDPNQPNFPDVAGFDSVTGGSNFLFAGPVPPSPFGTTEWSFTLPSICAATEDDLFVGLNIGPPGGGDGLFLPAVADSSDPVANLQVWDDPGPAAATIAEGSYVCVLPSQTPAGLPPSPTGDPATYASYLAQNYFEVYLEHASGGVCTTATNQPSFDVSRLANGDGTTNFLSGVHPDASSAPENLGRNLPPPPGWTGDRVGFVYSDHRLAAGDPVCVGVALQLAAEPIPLHGIAGTGASPSGRLLIDLAGLVPLGLGVADPIFDPQLGVSYSRYSFTIDLPAFTRDLLQTVHPSILWQGFGFSSSTGSVHATGVARQQF